MVEDLSLCKPPRAQPSCDCFVQIRNVNEIGIRENAENLRIGGIARQPAVVPVVASLRLCETNGVCDLFTSRDALCNGGGLSQDLMFMDYPPSIRFFRDQMDDALHPVPRVDSGDCPPRVDRRKSFPLVSAPLFRVFGNLSALRLPTWNF